MKITKDQIQSYIPQRAPFVMIDNLIDASADRFETDFLILPDNIFVENGILREFGLIENIAQTSAVGLFQTQQAEIHEPVDGFIAGISKLSVYALPQINDTIHTFVMPRVRMGNMFLLRAENYVHDLKLLDCEIKLVAIKPDF
jgi:predicted hotdog family 3-hydroxylacyl-ACP dehydratase